MSSTPRQKARLVLEDGSIFEGLSIGVPGTSFGEIVFNTCSTGYQEVLTDPSYKGQIVLMTFPEVGNYGVNLEDYESGQIHAVGLVVSRMSPVISSWRGQITLQEFLQKNRLVGIEEVDTRAITLKIRDKGAMKAGITTEEIDPEAFLAQVKAQPGFEEQDLIGLVTTSQPYTLKNGAAGQKDFRVRRLAVLDLGLKKSILNYLQTYVEELVVLPAESSFEDIRAWNCQGILLSNGPGDPSVLTHQVEVARKLVESGMPTFGICLGHQILGLACGASVAKMPFGHHGGNHPVKDIERDLVFITSQNHGYEITFDQLPEDLLKITHLNLNDGSIEGFRHQKAPVMSVQFHPEASPGPHDGNYIFESFMRLAAAN